MKVGPALFKTLKKCFFGIKAKGKNRSRVHAKFHMPHDLPLYDLTEAPKEKMSGRNLLIRAQEAFHHFTTIAGWFTKFRLEARLTYLKVFFCKNIKVEVSFIPDFTLARKHVFNGEKDPKLTKSFMKKENLHPKVEHVEMLQEKALSATNATRKIIKSKKIFIIYSLKERFYPNCEHS